MPSLRYLCMAVSHDCIHTRCNDHKAQNDTAHTHLSAYCSMSWCWQDLSLFARCVYEHVCKGSASTHCMCSVCTCIMALSGWHCAAHLYIQCTGMTDSGVTDLAATSNRRKPARLSSPGFRLTGELSSTLNSLLKEYEDGATPQYFGSSSVYIGLSFSSHCRPLSSECSVIPKHTK